MKLLSLILLTACIASFTSCAALLTPAAVQVEMSLATIGLQAAVAHGKVSPGDAIIIGKGVAVITSGDTTISKVVSLSNIGLDTAVAKGIINPGDSVLVKQATAVITQAITPPPAAPASIAVPSGQ
jgi:hypothetical protein